MSEQEAAIDRLEALVPLLAASAFQEARQQALDAGLSVLASRDGAIYEQFRNGERRFIMPIEPPVRVVKGTIIRIR